MVMLIIKLFNKSCLCLDDMSVLDGRRGIGMWEWCLEVSTTVNCLIFKVNNNFFSNTALILVSCSQAIPASYRAFCSPFVAPNSPLLGTVLFSLSLLSLFLLFRPRGFQWIPSSFETACLNTNNNNEVVSFKLFR
jgi:hypothetical protein